MFIGSAQSALGSRSQSAFDLSLSQSHRNEGESHFSQDYEWLYGQDSSIATEDETQDKAQKDEVVDINHSTDCFFFHQFMAIHQESPQLVRSDSVFDTQISTINSYLSGLMDKQVATSENADANS